MKTGSLLPAMLLLTAPLFGGQREVLTGNVTLVSPALLLPYDYLFQFDQGREPVMALVDEINDATVLKTWPHQRFEIERSVSISSTGAGSWPGGTSRGTVLRLLPSELLAPSGEPLSPERWAGANTGLHPTLHENEPFKVYAPSDYDGDGITDDVDVFPDNPNEGADNDADGTGDNADPDDDNDFMSDAYEVSNALNPLVDDAREDPDADGYTNVEESAAGTEAQKGGSYFHIESARFLTREKLELQWKALPGRRYEVWHRKSLTPRGSRIEEDLRVTEPGLLTAVIPVGEAGDFYYVLVIPDPF